MAYNASLANFMESQGIPYQPVSNEQVVSYLQANPGMSDTQIASAMNQYGVSPAQMAQATGVGLQDVQSRYEAANTQNQGIQSLINQAYGSVGITSPDQPGASYWQSQLQSGAIRPEDFQRSFLTTAAGVTDPTYAANVAKAQELLGGLNKSAVEQAYKTVLGRAGDTEGVKYFTEQLGLGALRPDQLTSTLSQAAIPAAKSLEDRLALQKYLGKDIYAPEAYLKGTSGMGYQDIVDYANLNVQDPVKVAQFAARYGIDPSEILAAKQAVGGQDIPTIKAIEDYLAKGRAGLGTRITDILSSTIGTSSGPDGTTISAIDRLAALQGALPKTQRSTFTPESFANKSIEEIETMIRSSPENRLDKADDVAGFLANIYGTPVEDAKTIRTSLFQNQDTDDKAEELYNAYINGTVNRDLINKFYIDAAKNNPTSPYFTNNPDELIKYTPIDKIVSAPKDSGQYGYYKDAPILSATEADKLLGNKSYVGGNNYFGYGSGTERDDSLGWDLRSKYVGSISNGAGVAGVRATKDQISEFDRIQKEINRLGGEKNGYVTVEQTDSETGQKYMANVPVANFFATETTEDGGSNGGENYKLYQDTIAALNDGAKKLGINTTNFNTPSSLFKAVDDRLKDTYIVTGRANNWDEDVARRAGITGVGQSRGGINHAQVMYEKVGDKLVPVKTLKTFNFDDPNTSRGFFGDLAQGIASLPFVAEAVLLSPDPFTKALYPVVKGAQTLALGGDFEDALKAGGLAYLTTNFIPKTLAPDIQGIISTNPLVSQLAQIGLESGSTIGADLANFITKAGSSAVISAGLASLTGQDPLDAATATLISSGVFQTTKAGLDFTDTIPDQYKPIVAKIITDTILDQDPKKSAINVATSMAKKELNDFMKTREVLTDERRPTIQA